MSTEEPRPYAYRPGRDGLTTLTLNSGPNAFNSLSKDMLRRSRPS